MTQKTSTSTSTRLALTAISISLVCVATMVFSIYVPQTRGFFNLGETMVYTVALLLGPLIGSVAGGVGSMFADVLLGYYHFAPATLVIKALEGGIVGFLGKKRTAFAESHTKLEWKIFTTEMGVLVGILLGLMGFLYYSGFVEVYSGVISPETPTLTIFVPAEFWFGLGAFVAVLVTIIAFISEPEFGWMIISTIFGGLLMVAGYFLYEQLFLGVFALAEVPVNIGQMSVGLIVATPIVKVVRRALPQLKS
ncbi:MAG: ECF transporter S component [Candidatus Bathyarchaeota archaeon]|nr:ECF transporter S component [Candidatus Bathyarchaeota archaeon]MDH5787412.1 ECF transporter S component [Candidatus Bathyarchaeota archaeon]